MKCGAWLPAAEAHAAIPQASLRQEGASSSLHLQGEGQQSVQGVTEGAISDPVMSWALWAGWTPGLQNLTAQKWHF